MVLPRKKKVPKSAPVVTSIESVRDPVVAAIEDAYNIDKQLARELRIQENQLNDQLADPSKPCPGRGPELAVGVDAEWKTDAETGGNEILSLQLATCGDGGDFKKIYFTASGAQADRFDFAMLITKFLLDAREAGAIFEWPKRVMIVGFFLRADLAAFRDFAAFATEIDAVGGSVATVGAPARLELSTEAVDNLLANRSYTADDRGVFRLLTVSFIDMARHVPMGTPLSTVGELVGEHKVAIPDGMIEQMDVLLAEDRELFIQYALQDAVIALRYYLHLKAIALEWTGVDDLPPTSSGLAMRLFKKLLKDAEINFDIAFGNQVVERTVWDHDRGAVRTAKETEPCEMRQIHKDFVSSCYHGGRNETFFCGPTPVGKYFDFDLVGAYTASMVDIGLLNFNAPVVTRDVRDFVGHVVGFALVRFRHPGGVRYPAFSVTTEKNGLLFPLQGESYATAPEIEVGLALGCEVEIVHGVIYPWANAAVRIFEFFVRYIRRLRTASPKGSLREQYAKLIGNGLYGKTAQGVKPKTVFDTRKLASVGLGPSAITNEVMAAHVTGLIRAVLAEVMNGIPADRTVFSVTTDGFLTDATRDELDLTGTMATRFQALCSRVAEEV